MSLVLKVLLFLSLINLFNAKANPIQPDCVTPDNALGTCVSVQYCVTIMTALLNNDHLTNPNVAKYLRESQCGIQIGSHKVCCDVNNIDFGETSEPVNYDPESRIDGTVTSKNCGTLNEDESPLKWIAELWFRQDNLGRIYLTSKCLGTLISSKHVVVPAHCIANLPDNLSLAHVKLLDHEYVISKIFIHGGYNKPKFANDIAIIELETENESKINNAICLQKPPSNTLKSTLAVMKSAESAPKYAKVEFIASNQCQAFFNQQYTGLTSEQFCANIHSNDTEPSTFIGAVILQSDNQRKYTLKGFTSTEVRSGQGFDESKPYIFTDVEGQLSWIQSAIGDTMNDAGLKECQLPNGIGRCVIEEHCALYRDAPKPLSQQREAFIEQLKCATTGSEIDGICCPGKYINQTTSNSDEQVEKGHRNLRALDLKHCGIVESTNRIVGGQNAGLREFPWYALLKYKYRSQSKFNCGGSLISLRYVLTCAHCITNLPVGYEVDSVRLGEYDLKTDPDCLTGDNNEKDCNPPVQDIEIEMLIPHEKYNNPKYTNDIGLIKLAREATINEVPASVTPICLPTNSEMQQPLSKNFTVSGFGYTERGRDSEVMLKIAVPKVARETCQSFHASYIKLSEQHTCYGGQGIVDSCKGDSGGPLINIARVNNQVRAVQFGIVASGHSLCGTEAARNYPGVYTDLIYYMDWILDNIND